MKHHAVQDADGAQRDRVAECEERYVELAAVRDRQTAHNDSIRMTLK